MGVVFIELGLKSLYFLTTNASSDNQSTFFSNTGFLNKLRTVLIILSATEGTLTANRE